MSDGDPAAEPIGDLLQRLLAAITLVEEKGAIRIEIATSLPDLIDAYPELRSPHVDLELARRQEDATTEKERLLVAAAQQVLEMCRKAGSAAPLRVDGDSGAGGTRDSGDLVAFLRVADRLGARFVDDGVLGAALSVARGIVLLSILDNDPQVDRDATREAAAEAFQRLDTLWRVEQSPELAELLMLAALSLIHPVPHAANQERAITYFEAALTVCTHDVRPHEWARTQNFLGLLYSKRLRGDLGENQERAIACYEAALTENTYEAAPEKWAETQNDLGLIYRDRQRGSLEDNQERAIACFESAINVFGCETYPDKWAITRANLGLVYKDRVRGERGDNQELAITCFEESLRFFLGTGAREECGRIQNYLGAVYSERLYGNRRDNQENAIAYFEAALSVFGRDNEHWVSIQINLGLVYQERLGGDHPENKEHAIECYEAALVVYNGRGDLHSWAKTQICLGLAYGERLRGELAENQERAIACFKAAHDALVVVGDLHEQARAQNCLGRVYTERLRGQRAENQECAIAHYEAALKVRSRDADPHKWAETQNNLAIVYSQRLNGERSNNEEQAMASYEAALTVITRDTDMFRWSGIQCNLGSLLGVRQRGERCSNEERAIACYDAALSVRTQEMDPHNWALIQKNLGSIYENRRERDGQSNRLRAIACFTAALPILRVTVPLQALYTAVALGRVLQGHGTSECARAAFEKALELRERLLAPTMSAEMRREAALNGRDLVVRLALLEGEMGLHEMAVTTLERGRALALREALALDDAWLAGLPAEQRASIDAAQLSLARLRANPPAPEKGVEPGQVRGWEESVTRAEASLEAAQRAAGRQPHPSLDAAELVALAPPGGALVLLAAAEGRGVAYVLPAGLGQVEAGHHVPLPQATTASLREKLIRWWDAYTPLRVHQFTNAAEFASVFASANTALEEVLSELWRDVMGAVVARLGELGVALGSELMLLPHGDLALLPLHATGPKGGRCVLDDYVVSYAPSGYGLRTAKERLTQRHREGLIDDAGRGRDLFGVFNPMAGTNDALLSSQEVEMPAAAALFVGNLERDARVYAGPDATVGRVLQEAGGAGYVHLSCHGGFQLRDPETSGLQLAGDKWLMVGQIVRELKLGQSRLVVLSACESGMVDVDHLPDEFVGLPAAFLQAGAPGVLATFWSVLDRPTAELMPRFYELHLKGKDPYKEPLRPGAALREAVLWLRRGGTAEAGIPRSFLPDGAEEAWATTEADTASAEAAEQFRHLASLPIVWAAYAYHGV